MTKSSVTNSENKTECAKNKQTNKQNTHTHKYIPITINNKVNLNVQTKVYRYYHQHQHRHNTGTTKPHIKLLRPTQNTAQAQNKYCPDKCEHHFLSKLGEPPKSALKPSWVFQRQLPDIEMGKHGVTVSTSAFLACHQYYCSDSSHTRGLNLQALVCGIFWSASPGVFSGYSGFLPSLNRLMRLLLLLLLLLLL